MHFIQIAISYHDKNFLCYCVNKQWDKVPPFLWGRGHLPLHIDISWCACHVSNNNKNHILFRRLVYWSWWPLLQLLYV